MYSAFVFHAQAVKNQVFLARVLHGLVEAGHMTSHVDHVTTSSHVTPDQSATEEGGGVTENYSDDGTTTDNHDECSASGQRSVRDLHWLVGRMARLARYEAGRRPQQPMKV